MTLGDLNRFISVTLTWALIELALHPDKQERLRKELLQLGDSEPSYDQLTNELPYLDAFFREILRLHSPVHQNHRLVRNCQKHSLHITLTFL